MVTCHCGPLGAGEKAMRTLKQFNDRRLVVNEAEAKTVRYILHATEGPEDAAELCDAAHLMLTVNAAVAERITSIAAVHDSFGCLASKAERFRKIIREQFVKMYEDNDVLAQVLEQAREDLHRHLA